MVINMKKRKFRKSAIALFLVIVSAIGLCTPCFAANQRIVTVRTASEAMHFRKYESRGIIGISKATLYRDNGPEAVYVVATGGVSSFLKTTTNAVASVMSGFALDTAYLRVLKRSITQYVPEGSKIVFLSHSFGGMVAQQFAGDRKMRDRYEIINILALGSPYILTLGTEGTLHRLADTADVIPLISTATVLNLYNNISFEDGGYGLDLYSSHNYSYLRDDVWGGYDCFGIKGGHYYLEIDAGSTIGINDRW